MKKEKVMISFKKDLFMLLYLFMLKNRRYYEGSVTSEFFDKVISFLKTSTSYDDFTSALRDYCLLSDISLYELCCGFISFCDFFYKNT